MIKVKEGKTVTDQGHLGIWDNSCKRQDETTVEPAPPTTLTNRLPTLNDQLTLLHSEQPKLCGVLAILSALVLKAILFGVDFKDGSVLQKLGGYRLRWQNTMLWCGMSFPQCITLKNRQNFGRQHFLLFLAQLFSKKTSRYCHSPGGGGGVFFVCVM